jgi:hypothetical protein
MQHAPVLHLLSARPGAPPLLPTCSGVAHAHRIQSNRWPSGSIFGNIRSDYVEVRFLVKTLMKMEAKVDLARSLVSPPPGDREGEP